MDLAGINFDDGAGNGECGELSVVSCQLSVSAVFVFCYMVEMILQ